MKAKPRKPYHCVLSLKDFERFDKDDRTTWRYGHFVNCVLEAITTVNPVSKRAIAEFMAIAPEWLDGALIIETGRSFNQFYAEWVWRRCWMLLNEDPEIQHDELARNLGFTDRKNLWKFLHKHGIVSDNRIAQRRPRPHLLDIWARDKIPTEEGVTGLHSAKEGTMITNR